jgi:short-subunit dehydrogenase
MPLALITGASSGFGYDLAHMAARHGYDVILVARSKDKLELLAAEVRTHGVQAHVVVADLSEPGAAGRVAATAQSIGTVEILVNSAGFGDYGAFNDQPWTVYAAMLQVNIAALTELTHRLLPAMIEQDRGHILNIASTASFQPAPWFGVYAATKAYVLSLSEALHEELHGSRVTVTAVCPGSTQTGFQAVAKTGESLLDRYFTMQSEPVVEAAWDAMMEGRAVVVPGWFNKLNGWFISLFPRPAARRMAAFMMKPR